MPLIDLNAAPSAATRRWFGFSLSSALILLAFLLSRWGDPLNLALLIASGVTGTLYYAWPRSQLTIIRSWQFLTYPISWAAGNILFGVIFFGLVLPLGLLLRLRGYDPLRLRKSERSSNWQDRPPSPPAVRYFKQF